MHRLKIVIVSPALADANNGNWPTARRCKNLLALHRWVPNLRTHCAFRTTHQGQTHT
jgi:hypothetical protein